MGSVGEHTQSGRALKLCWNSRAWFAKNFIIVSATARGCIGERDGLIPGQEYNEGRQATFSTKAEAARCYAVQPEPNKGSAEAATTQSSRELNRGSAEAAGGQEG